MCSPGWRCDDDVLCGPRMRDAGKIVKRKGAGENQWSS